MTIRKLASAGIPQILVNARMSERSFRGWNRFGGAARSLFSRIGLCLARTEEDAERYRMLGVSQVAVTGNLKFDAPPLAADPAAVAAFQALLGNRPVWVAASTHEGEEEIAAATHQLLRQRHPGLVTIIAPRHPSRGSAIRSALAGRGLSVAQRSAGEPIGPLLDIYLADTLGELGLFYRVAPVAFLGGSLVAHGGQNPIEPVRLDAAILHGPHVHNFESIYTALDGAGAAERIVDAESLAAGGRCAARGRRCAAPASRRCDRDASLRRRPRGDGAGARAIPCHRGEGQAAREVAAGVLVATRPERREPGARSAGHARGLSSVRRMARPPAFRAPVPGVCVGNFVLGGAGKTPTAIALWQIAKAQGFAPGFLASGYGGAAAGERLVDAAADKAAMVGDEPLLLAAIAPTVIGRDRAASAKRLIATGVDLIIMDDGFQNPRLAKDLSFAVVDAEVGIGNGAVFPAGPLRAPLEPQLRRADALIVVGAGTAADPLVRAAARAGRAILRARLAPAADKDWGGSRSSPLPASVGRRSSMRASPRQARRSAGP